MTTRASMLTVREYAQHNDVGFLFCVDETGRHVTVAGQRQSVEMIVRLKRAEGNLLRGMEIAPSAFPILEEGWPDEWHPSVAYETLVAIEHKVAAWQLVHPEWGHPAS